MRVQRRGGFLQEVGLDAHVHVTRLDGHLFLSGGIAVRALSRSRSSACTSPRTTGTSTGVGSGARLRVRLGSGTTLGTTRSHMCDTECRFVGGELKESASEAHETRSWHWRYYAPLYSRDGYVALAVVGDSVGDVEVRQHRFHFETRPHRPVVTLCARHNAS